MTGVDDMPLPDALAVLVIRDGLAPLGAAETVAEADGRALLIGSDTERAASTLPPLRSAWCVEAGDFAPGAWADALSAIVADVDRLLLPASPDGRDFAPRLAAALRRPLLANATRVHNQGAELARWDDQLNVAVEQPHPFVATLIPGVRGWSASSATPRLTTLAIAPVHGTDPIVLDVVEPDPVTADVTEASRIVAAGAGLAHGELTGSDAVALLADTAEAIGASLGATRVVTDAGWAAHERQIGTTGAVVAPELYIAFGISGAVQHTGGLDQPRHVVSVNTDPSAPMTAAADLGLVTDAQELLQELARRWGGGQGGR